MNGGAKLPGPLRAEGRKELSQGEFLCRGRGCWEMCKGQAENSPALTVLGKLSHRTYNDCALLASPV